MSTNSTDSEKVFEGCLVFILALIMMPLSAWWHAFVMLKLWNWFILPIQGAPALTIGNCMGVSLIVGLLTYGLVNMNKDQNKDKSPSEMLGAAFAKVLLVPSLLLFFGWLYQMWFMR